MRVLIADDLKDAARSLELLFRAGGHETACCFDGPSVLERAEGFAPDVCVLDLGMPGLNGMEVCRRLKAAGPEGQPPFCVALTGYGSAEFRQMCQEAGFDAFLVKPCDPDHLEELIARSKQERLTPLREEEGE